MVDGAPAAEEGEEGPEKAKEEARQDREHLAAALHALQTILESQPRLAAIMASAAALAPICNCIEPICRCGTVSRCSSDALTGPSRAEAALCLESAHGIQM